MTETTATWISGLERLWTTPQCQNHAGHYWFAEANWASKRLAEVSLKLQSWDQKLTKKRSSRMDGNYNLELHILLSVPILLRLLKRALSCGHIWHIYICHYMAYVIAYMMAYRPRLIFQLLSYRSGFSLGETQDGTATVPLRFEIWKAFKTWKRKEIQGLFRAFSSSTVFCYLLWIWMFLICTSGTWKIQEEFTS